MFEQIEKPWGMCQPLTREPTIQVDMIYPEVGGFSSVHLHRKKVNIFYVHTGTLRIRLYDRYGDELFHGEQTRMYELQPGMIGHVLPHIWHDFIAITKDVVVTEVYLSRGNVERVTVDPDDIIRSSYQKVGGIDESWT